MEARQSLAARLSSLVTRLSSLASCLWFLPTRLSSLVSRLFFISWRRKRTQRDFSEELQAHLALETDRLREEGLSEEEASAMARRNLGNITQAKERFYESHRWLWLDYLCQDVRFGLRQLRRNPGFTAVAVITLALGIGATAAVFSVANGVLIKPLAYDRSGRLVHIRERTSKYAFGYWAGVSAADAIDIKSHSKVFLQSAMFRTGSRDLTGAGLPSQVWVANVSANFFDVLTTRTALGRTFLPEEMETGSNRVAVISHSLWQTLYGGARSVLGKELRLNGDTYTIVGVLSAGFKYPSYADVWLPLSLTPKDVQRRSRTRLGLIVKLKRGVGLSEARANLAQLASRLAREYPDTDSGCGFQATTLQDEAVGKVRASLLVFLAAACFLLLIGCGNVASLLLARAATRRRELALRAAIGATRSRLFCQMLAEGLLLSLLGGTAGLALAACLIRVLRLLNPRSIPRLNAVSLDGQVLLFVLALSVLTTVMFGTLPALRASKPGLDSSLRDASPAEPKIMKLRRARGQSAAIVLELALAFVLVTGAGLLIKSFARLTAVSLGFDPSRVLSGAIFAPPGMWRNPSAQLSFFDQVLQRVRAVKAFKGVALSNIPPLEGGFILASWAPVGQLNPVNLPPADLQIITPAYFRMLGIRLIKGRFFSREDHRGAPDVAIINSALARQYWPNESPLGARIRMKKLPDGHSPTCTIVGVVDDTRYVSPRRPPKPEIYVPFSQFPIPIMSILVRTRADPSRLASVLRGQVASVDKDEPVADLTTLGDKLSTSFAAPQFQSLVFGTFAVIGLLLASIGTYGVLAYSVTHRTHEIGIRMALGAQKRDVLRLVVGRGMILTLIGVGIGIIGALGLTRFLSSLLYGVKPTDPVTFVAVSLILTAVALLACYIPARRAMKIDPMEALRYE